MLPLCSGFAKRAPATFPPLGFLYTARGLIMGLHRPVPVCIPLCNNTGAPWPPKQVGATGLQVSSTQCDRSSCRNTGLFSKFRRRWDLNCRPAAWRVTTYPLHQVATPYMLQYHYLFLQIFCMKFQKTISTMITTERYVAYDIPKLTLVLCFTI